MRTVLLRLLSKSGRYPADDLVSSSHLLYASAPIPWSAVSQRVRPGRGEYSEIEVFSPEEVQLFGALALALANPFDDGQIGAEPLTGSVQVEVPVDRLDLRSPEVRKLLSDQASELAIEESEQDLQARYPTYERTQHVLADATLQLIRVINVRDRLLIRGLSKFLSARALSRRLWFLEEAGIAAFISLEAALSIIRQHLEFTRAAPASFQEAYQYIRSTFPTGEALVDWLLELYDLRTIAMHPSSRFGEYWSPPMDADHCFELIQWLVPIYRHILLSELPMPDAA